MAKRFTETLDDAFQVIADNPERFPRWDEDHRFYLLARFPYYIAYRYEKSVVTVVRVAHTAQNFPGWASQ